MNILIAEDQPIIQLFYRKLIAKWGFDCSIATNGMEAVKYAKRNEGHYDLCITDVEMPKMNGIDAIAAIRDAVKYLPIMALTTREDTREKCIQAGADDFVLKPCLPASLLEKIRELTVTFISACIRNTKLFLKREK